MKFNYTLIALCCCSLFFIKSTNAQQSFIRLKEAVPQVEEKLNSENLQQRIAVLDKLVVFERDYDVTKTVLPFNLSANDYAYVIRKIFEKDLAELDTKTASTALYKIEFLMKQFSLKEFTKNLVEYIPKFAPNGMDFPRIGIQYGILGTLKNLNAVEFAPQIATLLQPSIRNLYYEALSTLVALRAKEAIPALLSLLYDKDSNQRLYALQSLVKVGAKQSAPQIARLLDDENPNTRYWALDSLVKLDARSQAGKIWQLVNTNQINQTESYAIAALIYFGQERAIPLAIARITEADLNRRGEMLRQLIELKPQAIAPALIEVLKDKNVLGGDTGTNTNIRAAVINLLQIMQARSAIPVLRSYLQERNNLQSTAAQALGVLNANEAVDDLLNVFYRDLPNPPDNITNNTLNSSEAALALAKIGDRKAWKDLITAAENPKYSGRSQIIIELNKHLDPDLWQKAQEKVFPPRQNNRQIVSIKELAEIYTRETGIPVVLHFEPGKDIAKRQPLAPPYKDTEGYPWAYDPTDISMLDGLREFPVIISNGTSPQNFTFIFDDKQIHILTVEKAVEWWRKNILTNR